MRTTFPIRTRRQLLLLAPVVLIALLTSVLAVAYWPDYYWIAGFTLTVALGMWAVAGVILWTLYTRPVLIALDANGIWLSDLGTLFPWATIDALQPIDYRGEALVGVLPSGAQVELFDHAAIQAEAAAHTRRGWPPLVIGFGRVEGDAPDFLAAVANLGHAGLIRR